MRYWLIIFFGLHLGCFAQDSTAGAPMKNRRFAIGLIVSPDFCFRTLVNVDHSATSDAAYKMDAELDRPKLGFTAGFSFRITFCKHLEFESALLYSNKGFATRESDLTFGDLIDRRRGFAYSTAGLPMHGKIIYNFHYLDLPLKINYLSGEKKIRFVCGAGVCLNFLLKQTSVFSGTDASGNATSTKSTGTSYNSINLSPCISAGIDWRLTARMHLRIEPTFRYGVLKIIDAPVTAYLWNSGLTIGYTFNF